MKYLLLILICCHSLFIKAQREKEFDCSLLQKAIETEVFKNQFYVCSSARLSIVDTSKYFSACIMQKVCNKEIKITHDTPVGINKNEIIILYKVDKVKNIHKLYFFYPSTGGTIFFTLKKRKDYIKIVKCELGAI